MPANKISTQKEEVIFLALLKNYLWDHHKIKLIMFPIPGKMTVYGRDYGAGAYNNFLPQLYERLEENGVPVIKIFDEFMASDEMLFYPTDTHWNSNGIEIGMHGLLEKLDSLGVDWRKKGQNPAN